MDIFYNLEDYQTHPPLMHLAGYYETKKAANDDWEDLTIGSYVLVDDTIYQVVEPPSTVEEPAEFGDHFVNVASAAEAYYQRELANVLGKKNNFVFVNDTNELVGKSTAQVINMLNDIKPISGGDKKSQNYLPGLRQVRKNGDVVQYGEIFNDYDNNKAIGYFSTAAGSGTSANADYSYVHGAYNLIDTEKEYLYIIGNGNSDRRSNALTVDKNGNLWVSGNIYCGDERQRVNKDDPQSVAEEVIEKHVKSYLPINDEKNEGEWPDDKYIKYHVNNAESGEEKYWEKIKDNKDFRFIHITYYYVIRNSSSNPETREILMDSQSFCKNDIVSGSGYHVKKEITDGDKTGALEFTIKRNTDGYFYFTVDRDDNNNGNYGKMTQPGTGDNAGTVDLIDRLIMIKSIYQTY